MSAELYPPLCAVHPREIGSQVHGPSWLIEPLWPHSAVGIVGGQPKSWKSWLALDLAVSVASGTPCIRHYPVARQGISLVYLAEDALASVRQRIECICASRGLELDRLDIRVITEPVLRLDLETDRLRLRDLVAELRPLLIVLDPLVRLHRLDENNCQEISELLGYLRELQRAHEVSVVLVHHTSKRSHTRQGQSLRGSSDLHAWTDVGLYLTWHGDQLRMTPELRTARAPEPIELQLVADDPARTHLAIRGVQSGAAGSRVAGPTLAQRILRLLEQHAPGSVRRMTLREALRVNNAKLGGVLTDLEEHGFIARSGDGWGLRTDDLDPPAADDWPAAPIGDRTRGDAT